MKHIYFLYFLISIVSINACTQFPNNKEGESKLVLSIDSVKIDSKNEIIDTRYGLGTFGFDAEKKFMYKFNTNNRHGLEVIDMDKLELVEFIPFEIEGPNGTTSQINSIQYVSDDEIIITNSKSVLIFNNKAELQHKYPISGNEFIGDSIPENYQMQSSGLFIPERDLSFNLINKELGYLRGFSKLDLYENTLQPYWLNELKKLDDYQISTDSEVNMKILSTSLYTTFQDNKFILSHDMENEVYYYNLKSDSIFHKVYKSQLSPNKNEVYGEIESESREEIEKIKSSRNKSIRFGSIVFDDKSNQFYRFSSFSNSANGQKEKRHTILTIFDEELNQINETDKLPLKEVAETYFVKDGKIYVYKNMEDEMGFLILNLSKNK